MIQNILENISNYLLDKQIEILPGNYLIGKGKWGNCFIEIRYACNSHLFMQTLIDDIWSENIMWNNENTDFSERVIIYICHADLELEIDNITIEGRLNLSSKFSKTIKYFYTIREDLAKTIFNKFPEYKRTLITSLIPKKHNEKPVFSIISTVFNNAIQLEQTIQSVINQSFQDFEYIIKDACSNDSFTEIIEKYKPYLSKIMSKKDNGVYFGMHEGVELSTGIYIAFLNSDDVYYSPIVLESYMKEFSANPSDAYYANLLRRNTNGELFFRKGNVKNIYRESCINHPTLFLKRNCYFEVGGFDLRFRIAADGDLTIKLLKAGFSFFHVNQIMVLMRTGGLSAQRFLTFKEEMLCRYRFNIFNIYGYLYIILRTLKNLIVNIIKTA